MDNITHSLVGAFTAEAAWAILCWRKERAAASQAVVPSKEDPHKEPTEESLKKDRVVEASVDTGIVSGDTSSRTPLLFFLAALFSNNICDLDIILGFYLTPSRLQYLLQHRGHSHTFLLAPLQSLLVVFGIWAWTKLKKRPLERSEFIGVTLLSLLGVLLHLGLDSLNQYGVHPFWPFNNQWFYGDMMFIVEPWLWVTLLPLLFFASDNRYVRAVVMTLTASGLGLLWFSGYVPWALALGIMLWSGILFWLFTIYENKVRLIVSGSVVVVILSVFGYESHWLRVSIQERFHKEEPGAKLNDVILSPFPSNAICWQVVTVETLPTKLNFKLRRGVVSLFSNLYSPESCLKIVNKDATYVKNHPQVVWTHEVKLSRTELIRIVKSSCIARAQMKFIRAPFWYKKEGKLFFADLRFETDGVRNFSTMEIPQQNLNCPKWVPPWTEPRLDLLSE